MTSSASVHGKNTTRLSRPLPLNTIDSHTHIIPPDFTRFPLLSTAQYKPTPHTISDATNYYNYTSGLGISKPRMVLTQVSVYGTDNSALLSGLAELGPNGRGVVECDPKSVTTEQLETWWAAGVRGVRINLVSVGRSITGDELLEMLQSYVDALAQHDTGNRNKKWVIEMYLPLKTIPDLLRVLPKINGGEKVRFCLDHFGGLKFKDNAPEFTSTSDPYTISGFSELVQLLTGAHLPDVYLKLSAVYRMDADYPSSEALGRLGQVGRELVSRAEDRVIWASDWPHTRFEKVDSVPFVEACYEWCGDGADGEMKTEKLFRTNSELLWDMSG